MTLTIADIAGLITGIGALSGLALGISNMRQTKALNAKLMAEAQKTKSEADKIEQEKTSEGMNSVVGGAKTVVDTGTTLLSGLISRIEKLEGQLTDKEEESIKVIKSYNLKIAKILRAIDRNISRRGQVMDEDKHHRNDSIADMQLQKDLSRILVDDMGELETKTEPETKEIKNG